jgi:hypothetical protein
MQQGHFLWGPFWGCCWAAAQQWGGIFFGVRSWGPFRGYIKVNFYTVFLRTVRTFVNVEIVTEDVEIGPYISWQTRGLD